MFQTQPALYNSNNSINNTQSSIEVDMRVDISWLLEFIVDYIIIIILIDSCGSWNMIVGVASQWVLKSQAADGDAAFLPLALTGISFHQFLTVADLFWITKRSLAPSPPFELGRNCQFATWNDLEPTLTKSHTCLFLFNPQLVPVVLMKCLSN